MKIVIDIPEDHKRVIDNLVTDGKGYLLPYEVEDTLVKAVRNGTPLPEHHGRLIDADAIVFENADFDTYEDYCIAFDAIDQADTIIEADRGE